MRPNPPGFPVVSKEWLLACYEQKKRVAMRNYLEGESVAPADDVTEETNESDAVIECLEPAEAAASTTSSESKWQLIIIVEYL